jgi:hypothetical protein
MARSHRLLQNGNRCTILSSRSYRATRNSLGLVINALGDCGKRARFLATNSLRHSHHRSTGMALYACGSRNENQDNLERQAERLIRWRNSQECRVSKVVEECGRVSMIGIPGFWSCLLISGLDRSYGRSHAKRKTEQVLAALQQNGLIRESEARESQESGQKEAQAQEKDTDPHSHAYSSHRG